MFFLLQISQPKLRHVDRRLAYINRRLWVSGTLPTVLIVNGLFLFFSFFEKVVVDQSNFLKSPTVKLKSRTPGLKAGDFRLLESTKQKKHFQKCC